LEGVVAKLEGEFVGAGGTFYVMSQLAFQGFHACLTYGNASHIDIVVANPNGGRAASIQVKTASWALCERGRGEARAPHHLDWALGRKAAKIRHEGFFLALVDLRGLAPQTVPDIYLVPAAVVARECESWVDTVTWVRFQPSVAMMAPYKNNWQPLRDALAVGVPGTGDGVASRLTAPDEQEQPTPAQSS
jgi:hypothetical protein